MATSDSTIRRYTESDPDVRLMLRVREGDALAFEELMARHQAKLVSLMGYLVGRSDMAEDLAQDVFLRVYRSRERYVPGSKFTTWLYTIANNVASNARRTLARRKEVNLAAPDPAASGAVTIDTISSAASGLMPTRQFDRSELREVVRQAVEGLGDRQRTAVLLSKFEHLDYAEIGEVMGMTPQAIKSLIARARGKLKESLEPYLVDPPVADTPPPGDTTARRAER
ncbi:RNA polymerase sigma factor CarQ [Pseudobythopirellula maris]|uniref:RNA polymerase sigma factor n=1 Tax=Pseudobythopirellula maris TaxID=2527991 RepID=A0A5C5ZXX2_9BACT|nr:sigma-70 family RNA polymerase sigma factor [Pseudobythopirellula maris]TWT91133.1 RNA polymerase sigma factor CarQ [Pseudobythopirellula maris]